MISLRSFLFCNVILTDADNESWRGLVFSFHDREDNEEKEDSITLAVQGNNENVIEFLESEIKSIELVDVLKN